jgi:excisionase family DNA binding protein
MTERLLLRPEDCAEALSVGRTRIYEMLGSGELPSILVGKLRRVPAEALKDWVDRQVAKHEHGTEL